MRNPETPKKIERPELNANYVREKLSRLGIPAAHENIDALLKLISMGSITDSMLEEALESKNPRLITRGIERYSMKLQRS